MPKTSKYPKLRTSVKRGKAGQAWVSYWYDMRGSGKSVTKRHYRSGAEKLKPVR